MDNRNIYSVLGLNYDEDSARRKVSSLYKHLRDNPEKYLECFNIVDIEKFVRKNKLENLNKI